MKKIIFSIILFITFAMTIDLVLSVCSPLTPCCCQEYPGGERKCFTSGICCLEGVDEYWDPISCFDFKFWVEPERGMFTVGKETQINLYIKNTGSFEDNYNITYNVTSSNPLLVQVDIYGFSEVRDVARGEIRMLYPKIKVLASSASGKILFNATSLTDQKRYRNATLTIITSDLPMSLPEYDFFGTVGIIVLVTIIYFIIKRKKG